LAWPSAAVKPPAKSWPHGSLSKARPP